MITYKNFELSDIPEISGLFIQTFNSEPWNDKWTVETAGKRLHQMVCTEDFYGLCAYEDGALCGMILGSMEQYFDGMTFNLKEFCVKNDIRGKGLGSKILCRFESELKKRGIKRIFLSTVRSRQTIGFYAKNNYYESKDLVIMEKEI